MLGLFCLFGSVARRRVFWGSNYKYPFSRNPKDIEKGDFAEIITNLIRLSYMVGANKDTQCTLVNPDAGGTICMIAGDTLQFTNERINKGY